MAIYKDVSPIINIIQNRIDLINSGKSLHTEDLSGLKSALSYISDQSTADVHEVKHGKWLLEREPNGKPYCFHCSVCDDDYHYIGIKTAYPICPNCGAKMDGE